MKKQKKVVSKMKLYRHGDVIIREVEKVEGKKLDHLVLAEGEITGHAHRVADGVAHLFQFQDKKYLEIQSELATLSHEEHKALQLPKGTYEIIIQRQYDDQKEWAYVSD